MMHNRDRSRIESQPIARMVTVYSHSNWNARVRSARGDADEQKIMRCTIQNQGGGCDASCLSATIHSDDAASLFAVRRSEVIE